MMQLKWLLYTLLTTDGTETSQGNTQNKVSRETTGLVNKSHVNMDQLYVLILLFCTPETTPNHNQH